MILKRSARIILCFAPSRRPVYPRWRKVGKGREGGALTDRQPRIKSDEPKEFSSPDSYKFFYLTEAKKSPRSLRGDWIGKKKAYKHLERGLNSIRSLLSNANYRESFLLFFFYSLDIFSRFISLDVCSQLDVRLSLRYLISQWIRDQTLRM